ncbi:GNAT family N-acetyltransferase [Litoribacter ruber]|uniref:GNAT family N-acetyltransferase n=1 Tax=Litoribacter ruber TaxID=702568 RepID=UPI001BD9AE30|nr:GNAT family N-acetyltransferase [Litoribacter ruber]MBT0809940.1 GNAT family N-acetyltransferase [Litoribacter ruber]
MSEFTNKANSPVEMKTLVGEEVFDFLDNKENQNQYDQLFEKCPWKTAFQNRDFISTWYRHYKSSYLPILVYSTQGDELIGVLSLAAVKPSSGQVKKFDRVKILGAGHYRAEYQVWLSEPHNSEIFIKSALKSVIELYPKSDIFLRFVPNGDCLDWVELDPFWKKHCIVQSFRRVLIKMTEPEFPKLFTKKEFKNKRNRLKRLEGFEFSKITDLEEFKRVLPDLTDQYDFRQGAMFNKFPFRDAPEMKELLVELFKKNMLHVTVMRDGEEILASIVAVTHKEWAHLGAINTHTPFHGKNSPGFVHFIMLQQMLSEEGFEVFDLTAGGDLYKERMANYHDYVYTLLFTQNQTFKIKRSIRKAVMGMLVKANIRPMSVELNIKRKFYLLKSRMKLWKEKDVVFTAIKKRLAGKKDKPVTLAMEVNTSSDQLPIRKNSLKDNLEFNGGGTTLSKWEYLQETMRKFETGETSYTWVKDGDLKACVWVSEEEDLGVPVIKDFYIHPSVDNEFNLFINQVAGNIQKKGEKIKAVVPGYDSKLFKILQKAGFESNGAA